jgi:hypothetical protein
MSEEALSLRAGGDGVRLLPFRKEAPAVFDWLFEGHLTVYVLLAGVAAVALFLWWQDRRRRAPLLAAGAALALIGLYFALDCLVETDREQIIRKVQEMADGIRANDPARVVQHLSDSYRSPQGRDRTQLQKFVPTYVGPGKVEELVVWDFRFPEPIDAAKGETTVVFQAKPRGPLAEQMLKGGWLRCEATFVKEEPHGWRIRSSRIAPLNQSGPTDEYRGY